MKITAEEKHMNNEQDRDCCAGVPVAFCEDAALSIAERTFSTEVDEQLANDIIQYAHRLHTLYTAPQPTEQQAFEWPRLDRSAKVGATCFHKGVSSRLVIEAAQRQYDYDATPEKEAERKAKFVNFRKEVLQPALDAAGLVEALEQAHMALIGYLPGHRNDITDAAISQCEQALAAYRMKNNA